jgi:hypothetical protein
MGRNKTKLITIPQEVRGATEQRTFYYEKQKHTSSYYSYIRILSSCDIPKHLTT